MNGAQAQWEKAIAEWNNAVFTLPNTTRLQEEIEGALIANDCMYRFSAERFKAKEGRWENALSKRELRHDVIDGQKVVEVPIGTTLRPAFLPPSVLSRLHQLGSPLEQLLALSRSYLLDHPETCSLFGDPVKSEISWIGRTSHISPITQWSRIDFLWKWAEGGVEIKLLDINLLPGMTFINRTLSKICGDLFSRYGLCEHPDQVNAMAIDKLTSNMVKWVSQRNTPKAPSSLKLAVLARKLHGLAIEARLCANSLKALGAECSVVSPVELHSMARSLQLDGIIRMCRPVSKHAVGHYGFEDNSAFSKLAEVFSNTPLCPFFNAFLESHAWFFVWQTESFKNYAEALGQEQTLSTILPLLPKTGVVLSDLSVEWPSAKHQLSPDALQNVVLKRANSTGAQDLTVLHRASSRQRETAFRKLQLENGSGWVIQELIESQKEKFPLHTRLNRTLSCVEGFMVYGAYFSDRQYLGAHAVMTPFSRKVHGGFDSFLMPTFSAYERN